MGAAQAPPKKDPKMGIWLREPRPRLPSIVQIRAISSSLYALKAPIAPSTLATTRVPVLVLTRMGGQMLQWLPDWGRISMVPVAVAATRRLNGAR